MKIYNIFSFSDYKLFKSRIFLIILLTYTGCKKDQPININGEEIISPTIGTRTEFTLDSIFLYAKQIYLWNDALPEYRNFLPREKYANIKPELSAFKKELFDISQLKLNSATGLPFVVPNHSNMPKYSYLQPGNVSIGGFQGGLVNGEVLMAKSINYSADKTIAYVALGSFPSLTNSKSKLDQVFDEMAVEKPKYLVLDLRYNGGGYVETAEYVANLIVPSALNGKVMYTEHFNATLQAGNAHILRYQPYLNDKGKTIIYNGRMATLADVDYTEKSNTYKYEKKGTLESIQDIYIIVSGQTASASELLISCLKPYFNVKLVGERTYGKPVGFFGINIDRYSIYLSSFLIKNAQGWSDYFAGMEPDISVVGSSNPVLGDPEELCLKAAISAINGNKIILSVSKKAAFSKDVGLKKTNSNKQENQTNIGLIETRLKLK